MEALGALRTTLQIQRLGDDRKWLPSFTIALANERESVVLQIVDRAHERPLPIHLIRYDRNVVVEDQLFAATIDLNQRLAVWIDWTATGRISITLDGGETRAAVLHAAPSKLVFLSSPGEVRFDPLNLGHSGS